MFSQSRFFTVFTPTRDRAELLSGAYRSLLNQSFRDFEWIIVDDGSSDGTGDMADKWKKEAPFPVIYIRQEKSGKHVAANRGAAAASGIIFVDLDSDDRLAPEALSVIKETWESIPEAEREGFCGVWGLCEDTSGRVIGKRFPEDIFDSDYIEMTSLAGLKGDRASAVRTDIRRAFPFPEDVGEFCPESLIWNRIALSYKTRFINRVLKYVEYRPRGLSDSGAAKFRLFPEGYIMRFGELLDIKSRRLPFKERARAAAHYIRSALHGRVPVREQVKRAGSVRFWFLMFIPGALLYLRDKAISGHRGKGFPRKRGV